MLRQPPSPVATETQAAAINRLGSSNTEQQPSDRDDSILNTSAQQPNIVEQQITDAVEQEQRSDQPQLNQNISPNVKVDSIWDRVQGLQPEEREQLKQQSVDSRPADDVSISTGADKFSTPSDDGKASTPSSQPPLGAQKKIGNRKKIQDKSIQSTKAGVTKVLSLTSPHVVLQPQTESGAQRLAANVFAVGISADRAVKQEQQDPGRSQELKWRLNRAKANIKQAKPINPPGADNYRLVVSGDLVYSKTMLINQNDELSSPIEFGLDCHADISILPERFLPKNFDYANLTAWNGQVSGAVSSLEQKGTIVLPVNLEGTIFNVSFLVTSNDRLPYPLLGLDFWHATQCNVIDWSKGLIKLRNPDEKTFTYITVAGTSDAIPLRLSTKQSVPARSAIYAAVQIPKNREEEEWICERVFTTSGELNIPVSLAQRTGNTLYILLNNWGTETVDIAAGALIGQATPVVVTKQTRENQHDHTWHDDYDKFKNAMKVYSLSTHDRIHAVSSSDPVQSYEEHRQDSESKEDLSYANIGPQWTKPEERHIREFLKEWIDGFARNPLSPKAYKGPKFQIPTGEAIPTKENPRRCVPAKEEIIAKHIETMLQNEIIEKATSPWAAPVVLAKKKDGSWRFCVDYRRLNSVTKKDSYPLPRIDDVVDALGSGTARVFSTLDVASGYWHIPIADEDKEKTAFTTNSGTYQFRVLPFGLTGAPGAFCRAMHSCLKDLLWKCTLVYVDDIVVWSQDFQTHQKDLAAVFSRLIEHGFQLKLSKCSFFMNQVEYLGFIISEGKISVCKKKIQAIMETEPPNDLKSLQRFLGMLIWYQRFIKDYSEIAAPLYELTTKFGDLKENWKISVIGHPQNTAFNQLKEALCKYPVMRLPDFSKPFIITCDASSLGTGGVLVQEHNGFEHPVYYTSKAIKKQDQSKHSYYNETIALIRALKRFYHYLAHAPFTVATDCRALSYWNTSRDIPQHVERYLVYISQFPITFVHRPGKDIPTPDFLSRSPNLKPKEREAYVRMDLHRNKPFNQQEMNGRFNFNIQQQTLLLPINTENTENRNEPQTVWNAQAAHPESQTLIKLLSERKEGRVDVKQTTDQKLLKLASKMMVMNNKLFKQPNNDFNKPRPYVPPGTLRKRIIIAYHDDVLAGHGGVDKTLQRIKSRFWWEGMTQEITLHVKKCTCALNKASPAVRHPPLVPIKVGKPFESWTLDHIKMPRSRKGNEYILTMVDRFTKMVELAAVQTKSMDEVVHKFTNRVLLRWGIPKTVLGDGAFRGSFEELCEENGIQLDHNLPYQHTTMGLVERMNRTINETLRNYVNADKDDWDDYVRTTQFAINSGLSSAHTFTPFKVGTTRDPAFPIERLILQESTSQETPEPPTVIPSPNTDKIETQIKSPAAKKPISAEPSKTVADDKPKVTKTVDAPKTKETEATETANAEKLVKPTKVVNVNDHEESEPDTANETVDEAQQTIDTAKIELQKSKHRMVNQYNSNKKIGHYKVGEWVMIKKHVKDTKLDSQKIGPYKVVGLDIDKVTNIHLQFCGIPGTQITAHQSDLIPWNSLKDEDVNSSSFPVMEWKEPRFLKSSKLAQSVQTIRDYNNLKREEPIRMDHLLGKKVKIYWPKWKEWHEGTIIAHEGKGSFWVYYPKLSDEDNPDDHIFPEHLLNGKAPKWSYAANQATKVLLPEK